MSEKHKQIKPFPCFQNFGNIEWVVIIIIKKGLDKIYFINQLKSIIGYKIIWYSVFYFIFGAQTISDFLYAICFLAFLDFFFSLLDKTFPLNLLEL